VDALVLVLPGAGVGLDHGLRRLDARYAGNATVRSAQAKNWLKTSSRIRPGEQIKSCQPPGNAMTVTFGPSMRDQRAMWRQSRTISAASACIESTGHSRPSPLCTFSK